MTKKACVPIITIYQKFKLEILAINAFFVNIIYKTLQERLKFITTINGLTKLNLAMKVKSALIRCGEKILSQVLAVVCLLIFMKLGNIKNVNLLLIGSFVGLAKHLRFITLSPIWVVRFSFWIREWCSSLIKVTHVDQEL